MTAIQILFWFTAAATLLQLGYWLGVFSRLAYYREEATAAADRELPPFSVIICARNEAENLQKNLTHVLEQDYPQYEVIVVDDQSTDKSWEILLDIKKKYPILRLIPIKEQTLPGKKAALSRGIEAAQFESLLLTDADCRPASKYWIRGVAMKLMHKHTDIVLGYSPYNLHTGFLNIFIRFETVYTAVQYFSLALWKIPYMGVGRNLAYLKSLFRSQQGFLSHQHIASGDDDLFINQAANRRNTAIIIHPDTFVLSEPKRTWRSYYYQKSRHLTTGSRYRRSHQLLLGGLAGSHVIHYLGVLALLPTTYAPGVILMFLVRMGVVLWMYARILKLLQDSSLLRWIPLLDAAFCCYYLFLSPVLLTTGNLKKWKL